MYLVIFKGFDGSKETLTDCSTMREAIEEARDYRALFGRAGEVVVVPVCSSAANSLFCGSDWNREEVTLNVSEVN